MLLAKIIRARGNQIASVVNSQRLKTGGATSYLCSEIAQILIFSINRITTRMD